MSTPRNRSTRYEDHQRLVQQKARLYFSRLEKAGIMGVELDDVVGELGIAFTKAVAGYNPESEYVFTTYLGICMQNHFNKYANRLMLEHFGIDREVDWERETPPKLGLGYISIEDATAIDDDGVSMGYASFEDDAAPSPDRIATFRQDLESIYADDTLLPETRTYIGLIANPGMEIGPRARARLLAKSKEIRKEVEARWGVKLAPVFL